MHGDNTSRAKSIYIGFLENYRYEKTGYCYDKNEVYEGDYHHGVKQGYGKLKNTIHKYIGNFENNLYSGQGQLLTGKDLYVGEFREGLRHGCGKNQGAMTYDGEWANNYPHGSGCLSIEGSQYIGMFEKGELMEDAEITIRFDNGGMYKGFVRNKIPEGRGCMIDEHGVMQTGIF